MPFEFASIAVRRTGFFVGAFLLLCATSAPAQFAADTARGLVGKEVVLPFTNRGEAIEAGAVLTLRGDVKLSNPTVFFPQAFRDNGSAITDSVLERFTDSTYSFALTVQAERAILPGDTLFLLAGEALTGSDSVTALLFGNLFLNETPVADFTATVITESVGPPFPYVRFAVLDPGRPNPTKPGLTVTWGFRIDRPSEVTFKIYDLIGQEIAVQELGMLDNGVYVNTFTPDFFFPSGMFIVRLISNSGEAFQVMHVLR